MKKLFAVVMILGFIWGAYAFADDGRCPLTGNTYVLEVEDVRFELSGFVCIFGPGCQAECDLWWGNFDTGPIYHARLPFNCETTGDVIIAGLPCALTSDGDLECLFIDVSNYTCQKIGTKTYCLQEEIAVLRFEEY